jgi:hypothetical protein
VSYVLDHLEAFENKGGVDRSSATFSHYDYEVNERGWIVVHPRQALVAGISENQAQTLIDVLQRRDIDLSGQGQGIIASTYEEVLARIESEASSETSGIAHSSGMGDVCVTLRQEVSELLCPQ